MLGTQPFQAVPATHCGPSMTQAQGAPLCSAPRTEEAFAFKESLLVKASICLVIGISTLEPSSMLALICFC